MDFKDIKIAQKRIQEKIYNTPIIRIEQLDELLGCKVFLKLENIL